MDLEQILKQQSKTVIAVGPLADRYVPEIRNVHNVPCDVVESLSDVANLNDYALCIVSTVDDLKHEKVANSIITPVLYVTTDSEKERIIEKHPEETLEGAVERFTGQSNLFDFLSTTDFKQRSETILRAMKERAELLKMLEALPENKRSELLRGSYAPTSFYSFEAEVNNSFEEHRFAQNDATFRSIMERYHGQPSKNLEQEAAILGIQIIKDIRTGTRKVTRLGHSLRSEEGSIEKLNAFVGGIAYRRPDLPWNFIKIVADDRSGNKHADIAWQRYSDSNAFADRFDFKTPSMRPPVNISERDANMPYSLLLMEEVEGPSLNRVLEKMQGEITFLEGVYSETGDRASLKRRDTLIRLRKEFVRKYVDDVVIWQLENLKTFVKKPTEKKLVEEYYSRLSNFDELFKQLAPGLFSEEESLAFLEGINCFKSLNASPENIVRVRDASLANVHLRFDKVRYREGQVAFTLDDVLRNATNPKKENGSSIERGRINEVFYHVDLHYRYGHIFEDLAHLLSEVDCAFLLRGERGFNESGVRSLTHEFLNSVGRSDLKNDELSMYLMLFYRSARKLKLYADRFSVNTYDDFEKGNISKNVLDKRLRSYERYMAAHARSCHFILGRLRSMVKDSGVKDDEMRRVNAWYSQAKVKYDSAIAKDFVESLAQLEDPKAHLYWQVSALTCTYQKLKSHLDKHALKFEGLWNGS